MLSTGHWTLKLWIVAGPENIPRDTLLLQISPKHSHKQLPCTALSHSLRETWVPLQEGFFKEFQHFNYCSYTPEPGWLDQYSALLDISNSYHRSNLLRANSSEILEFKETFQITYQEPKNRWYPAKSSRVLPWNFKSAKFLIMRHTDDKQLIEKLNVFPKLKHKQKVK